MYSQATLIKDYYLFIVTIGMFFRVIEYLSCNTRTDYMSFG